MRLPDSIWEGEFQNSEMFDEKKKSDIKSGKIDNFKF